VQPGVAVGVGVGAAFDPEPELGVDVGRGADECGGTAVEGALGEDCEPGEELLDPLELLEPLLEGVCPCEPLGTVDVAVGPRPFVPAGVECEAEATLVVPA